MSKESLVKDPSGHVTHIRLTSDDGQRSYLYKYDDSITGLLLSGGKGQCVEIADHEPDGTTTAHEPDNSIIGAFLFGGKGAKK